MIAAFQSRTSTLELSWQCKHASEIPHLQQLLYTCTTISTRMFRTALFTIEDIAAQSSSKVEWIKKKLIESQWNTIKLCGNGLQLLATKWMSLKNIILSQEYKLYESIYIKLKNIQNKAMCCLQIQAYVGNLLRNTRELRELRNTKEYTKIQHSICLGGKR